MPRFVIGPLQVFDDDDQRRLPRQPGEYRWQLFDARRRTGRVFPGGPAGGEHVAHEGGRLAFELGDDVEEWCERSIPFLERAAAAAHAQRRRCGRDPEEHVAEGRLANPALARNLRNLRRTGTHVLEGGHEHGEFAASTHHARRVCTATGVAKDGMEILDRSDERVAVGGVAANEIRSSRIVVERRSNLPYQDLHVLLLHVSVRPDGLENRVLRDAGTRALDEARKDGGSLPRQGQPVMAPPERAFHVIELERKKLLHGPVSD